MKHQRRGTALLESLIALLVVAIAGVSLLSLASACLARVRAAHAADLASRDASAFLDAVALWPRNELMQRLGRREQGPFLLDIARPEPTVFDVRLADSTGARELLRTRLFRPYSADDRP